MQQISSTFVMHAELFPTDTWVLKTLPHTRDPFASECGPWLPSLATKPGPAQEKVHTHHKQQLRRRQQHTVTDPKRLVHSQLLLGRIDLHMDDPNQWPNADVQQGAMANSPPSATDFTRFRTNEDVPICVLIQ